MTPKETGHLRKTKTGADLVLERVFRGTPADVWRSLTDPESTARWFGRWEGEGGVGNTIRMQMAFEDTQPWMTARIEACEPQRHLGLYAKDDYGEWHLDLTLAARGEETVLTFVHHLAKPSEADNVGPGWEYYLDNLAAAFRGAPLPKFTDYHPAQKAYYAAQIAALDG